MARRPIRIVLADLPRLLHDLVAEEIHAYEDMLIVEDCAHEAPPDFLVAPLEDGRLPERRRSDIEEAVRRRVIGIELDEGDAVLMQLRPEQTPMGPLSPGDLVLRMRAIAGRP